MAVHENVADVGQCRRRKLAMWGESVVDWSSTRTTALARSSFRAWRSPLSLRNWSYRSASNQRTYSPPACASSRRSRSASRRSMAAAPSVSGPARCAARARRSSAGESPAGTGPECSASRHGRIGPGTPASRRVPTTESPLVTCSAPARAPPPEPRSRWARAVAYASPVRAIRARTRRLKPASLVMCDCLPRSPRPGHPSEAGARRADSRPTSEVGSPLPPGHPRWAGRRRTWRGRCTRQAVMPRPCRWWSAPAASEGGTRPSTTTAA